MVRLSIISGMVDLVVMMIKCLAIPSGADFTLDHSSGVGQHSHHTSRRGQLLFSSSRKND